MGEFVELGVARVPSRAVALHRRAVVHRAAGGRDALQRLEDPGRGVRGALVLAKACGERVERRALAGVESGHESEPPSEAPARCVRSFALPIMGAPLAGGVALANKATLGKRLRDPTNPLTSSDAYERTSHLQSIASGHQSGGGHGEDVAWNVVRQAKLAEQAPVSSSLLFAGVVAYVNGYTGRESLCSLFYLADKRSADTTDLELKKMIQRQGGMVLFNLSAKCTHILALVRLSGSKEEKFLRMQRNKMNLKVVTPSWVLDSVRNGRRANEAAYAVIRSDVRPLLVVPSKLTTPSNKSRSDPSLLRVRTNAHPIQLTRRAQ